MKKIVYLFGCVMLLALFSSCERDNETPIETGSVVGVVFDRDGNPAQGIQVSIGRSHRRPEGSFFGHSSMQSFVTGSDGRFSFENITPGGYSIWTNINPTWRTQFVTVIAGVATNVDFLLD